MLLNYSEAADGATVVTALNLASPLCCFTSTVSPHSVSLFLSLLLLYWKPILSLSSSSSYLPPFLYLSGPLCCLSFSYFLLPFHFHPSFFSSFFRLLPSLPSLRLYLTLCYLLSFSTSTSLLFIFNSPLPSSLLSLNSGLFFHLRQIFSPSSHVSRRGLSHFHTLSIIWYWAVTMDL